MARRIALFLGLTTLLVPGLSAQGRTIELTPFVGGFIPTQALGRIPILGAGSQVVNILGEATTTGALGGRITVSGRGRFGIEGTYFYSGSDMRVTVGPIATVLDGEVQGGSLKGVYRATNGLTGTDLLVGAGLSAVHHSGRAYTYASGQFDVGGVLGAGLHIVMSPMVTLRFDGEAYLYNWSATPLLGSRMQTDVLMTVGLGLKLGR
ncbi:MAG: hypothetical protein SFV24_18225 [Gemmatimonadales bacterium]|nr:hypothetical protein [Gemmatimonadales bacterium]